MVLRSSRERLSMSAYEGARLLSSFSKLLGIFGRQKSYWFGGLELPGGKNGCNTVENMFRIGGLRG